MPDKPDLVFIHGWGSSRRMWEAVLLPPLSTDYNVHLLDLPGTMGQPIVGDWTTVNFADWVAQELSTRRVERFAIVGHSMGGNIACHLAVRHPSRVQALAIVGGAIYSDRFTLTDGYLHPLYGDKILGTVRALGGAAGWIESRVGYHAVLSSIRTHARRYGYMQTDNSVSNLQKQIRALLETPAESSDIPADTPTLFIHGNKDSVVPIAWAKEAVSKRNGLTSVVYYPSAQHCPMDTQTEDFVYDLSEFLRYALSNQM